MNKFAFILTFFLFSSNIYSQDLNYGLRLGINNNSSNNNCLNDNKNKISYSIGAFFDKKISHKLKLSSELYYNSFLMYRNGSVPSPTQHISCKFKNLIVLSGLKYDISNNPDKGMYLFLGPKATVITNKKDFIINIQSIYLGGKFAIGFDFLKNNSIQLSFDHDFNPFIIDDPSETRLMNLNLTLYLNLEKIMNK